MLLSSDAMPARPVSEGTWRCPAAEHDAEEEAVEEDEAWRRGGESPEKADKALELEEQAANRERCLVRAAINSPVESSTLIHAAEWRGFAPATDPGVPAPQARSEELRSSSAWLFLNGLQLTIQDHANQKG